MDGEDVAAVEEEVEVEDVSEVEGTVVLFVYVVADTFMFATPAVT